MIFLHSIRIQSKNNKKEIKLNQIKVEFIQTINKNVTSIITNKNEESLNQSIF